MEFLGGIISWAFNILNLQFEIWGFEISLWQVYVFSIVAALLLWAILEAVN